MIQQRIWWLGSILVVLGCCQVSFARDEPFSPSDEPGIIGKWVNRAHQEISTRVLKTSERFDAFFGDQRIKEEEEVTQIIIAPTLTFSKDNRIEVSCPLTVNLALPYLKNRWHLMVETLWQEEQEDDDQAETSDDEERDVTVSLRYKVMRQAQHWLSFDAGVKIQADTILSPFGRVRFRHLFDWDPWGMRFTQFLFWLKDGGWGESSHVDVDRKLGEDLLFRISNQALWSENSQGVEFSQTYGLRWQLSRRRAVEIDLIGRGRTRPSLAMDEYEATVIFRRRLYKNWVFSEIKPGMRAVREDNFDWNPFVMVKLECTFGEISAR